MNKKWIIIFGSLLVVGLLITLMVATKKTSTPQLQGVKVKLRTLHNAQYAGMYYAESKGYYAAEGLDVEFEEATLQKPSPTKSVHEKEAQFGVASAPDVIADRSNLDRKVVAVATIFQHDSDGYGALKSSGIKELKEASGRRVGLLPGKSSQVWADMLKVQNLSSIKYSTVVLDPTKADKTTDIFAVSLTDPTGVNQAELVKFNPYDYGITTYNDSLITHADTIAGDPALVRRFLRATIRGWKEALADADGAIAATRERDSEAYDLLEPEIFRTQLPFIQTNDAPLLWTDAQVWQSMYRRLNQNSGLKSTFDVSQAFDTSFIRAYYGAD